MPTGTTRSPALITSVVLAPLPTLTTAGLLLVTVTAVSAERGVRSNRTPSVAATGLPAAAITRPIPGDGTTETPIHEDTLQTLIATEGLSRPDAERTLLRGKQPTGRLVSADQVAALIAFLCSAEAADITGAVLPIDGGWSAG